MEIVHDMMQYIMESAPFCFAMYSSMFDPTMTRAMTCNCIISSIHISIYDGITTHNDVKNR